MQTLTFTKMQGLGNDFVVVDATKKPFELDSKTIQTLGNRRLGIGFDQLLVIESATQSDVDFDYRIFNTDGLEVEHCGNGARCFARYAVRHELTHKTEFRVRVKKGIIDITYHDDDAIEVDMGDVILAPSQIPFAVDGSSVSEKDDFKKQYNLNFHGEVIPVSVVSMGNPHAVFTVSNVWDLQIAEMAAMVQTSSYFPDSVNVNFAEMIDENTVHLRTYERGVGETNACGTGACASAFVLHEFGAIKSQVTVKMRGGELKVIINDKRITMIGNAREVFTGEIPLPIQL